MLVLSRKIGERIIVGGSVVVTIVAARGGTVRVGLDAPRETEILRGELAPNSARVPRPCQPPAPESEAVG